MILYRLIIDGIGLVAGSCLTEKRFGYLPHHKKELFERINEEQQKGMINFIDKDYCRENGIECMLFYSDKELSIFINKMYDNGIVD